MTRIRGNVTAILPTPIEVAGIDLAPIITTETTSLTQYYSIAGALFHARFSDTDNIARSPNAGGGIEDSAGGVIFFAQVNLPHGSVVTACVVYSNSLTEAWYLRRSLLTNAAATGVIATANMDTEDTTITNATIDNQLYTYNIETQAMDINDIIDGARITYTTR